MVASGDLRRLRSANNLLPGATRRPDFATVELRRMRMVSDSNGSLTAGRLLPLRCPVACDFGRTTGEDPVQSSGRPASNIDGGSREFLTNHGGRCSGGPDGTERGNSSVHTELPGHRVGEV